MGVEVSALDARGIWVSGDGSTMSVERETRRANVKVTDEMAVRVGGKCRSMHVLSFSARAVA